jgi:predicted RND superfamily exporter protein
MTTFKSGEQRFNTLHTLRKDLNAIIGDGSGKTLFPYTTGFLTWEEVGIIKEELVRNLIIASGVICVIVCLLIPAPRISLVVILNIFMSVVEVVGMAHFWGQYFNGVTTIYFLICVGLGVDYSAHIGHYFKDGKGTSAERALEALTRIGPSVFNALVSTILAVVVLAFAKSFVFEVFFRILLLVTLISGSHGLVLLPVLLSLLGGDNLDSGKPKDAEAGVKGTEIGAKDAEIGAKNAKIGGEIQENDAPSEVVYV